MMNKLTKELMLEAGYAAPQLASRAQKLVQLVVQECCMIIRDSVTLGEPVSTYADNLSHQFRVSDDTPN